MNVPGPVRKLGIAAALIALPVVAGRLLPGVFTNVWALNLGFAFSFAAAALALNVVMGYAGQISLGHAAFLGVGAFTAAILTSPDRLGLPFFLAVLVATVVGASIAFVLGLVSLRISGLYLAISTLVFGVAMFDGVFKSQGITGGSAGVEAGRPVAGEFVFIRNSDYLGLVVALLVVVWLVDRNVERTKLGRAFEAIKQDEDVARSLGVHVSAYKISAFVIAGALAGIAGAMYAPLTFVQADNFPFQLSLLFVVMLVLGGLGSRTGAFLAASFFVIFPRAVREIGWDFLLNWELVVGSGLLLFTLVRHPGGLAQAMLEARERKEARSRKLVEDVEHDAPVMAALPAPRGADAAEVPAGRHMLEVSDLTVRFGGLHAVDEATFDVPVGKIVGLIGPNGAGKTTCFNAISGLVRPTSGRVVFKGTDVTELRAYERAHLGMGRTFQLLGLAKDLTVRENLLLAQHRLARYPGAESVLYTPRVARVERDLEDAAAEALATLGFERFRDTPLRHLSHGQQRLVELAAALVTSPDVLLLDEPSGGMAPNAAESLAERLIEIRDRLGRTVLLIEHHIPLVLAVCDSLHVLAAGSVLASGTPEEIVRDPAVVEAYLGPGNGETESPKSPARSRTGGKKKSAAKRKSPAKKATRSKKTSRSTESEKRGRRS